MGTYNDEAVVLRTHKLGEADRIITLLTRGHGKIRAVAKGVRRTSSKIGARLGVFNQVEVQIVEGRSLDIVAQVVSRRLMAEAIVDDYARYTAAQAMVETADRLVDQEGQPALQQYRLLVGGLRVLGEGTTDGIRPPGMVLDAYLLRALAVAGYAPVLDACAQCGRAGVQAFFHPQSGGMVCAVCRPPGAGVLAASTAAYLGALLAGRWEETRQVESSVLREASGVVAAFTNWHLERGLRSLRYVERG